MNERAKARISILLVTCMLLSGCAGDADIEEEPEEIPGCMDENAENYNPDATVSDRSCVYAEPEPEGPDVNLDSKSEFCDDVATNLKHAPDLLNQQLISIFSKQAILIPEHDMGVANRAASYQIYWHNRC